MDRAVEVGTYLDEGLKALREAEGYCLSSGGLSILAKRWPELTVAELVAAFEIMQDTKRARRRIQKGEVLQ